MKVQSEPPADDVSASPLAEENSEGRVVIDFTVGPPGVGPATGITPDEVGEILTEGPPAE